MNKVYKLVWSKVRNCWVAVSELAKSRTKAPRSGVVSRTVVAGVLACVLSCGVVMPNAEAYFTDYPGDISTISPDNTYFSPNGSSSLDWTDPTGKMSYSIGVYTYGLKIGDVLTGEAGLADATDVYNALQNLSSTPYIGINSAAGGGNEDGSGAVGMDAIAIGKGASANDTSAIAIGVNANTKKSTGSSDSSIAIGENAKAWADINDTVTDSTISAIAIGKDAKAEGTGAVSIGYISQAKSTSGAAFGRYSKALGTSSTALGSEAVANGSNDVAIGFSAKTSEGKYSSVAIGSSSFTNANNSVALGVNSVASDNYVVSIGHLAGDLQANGTAYNDEMKRRIVNVADGTSATEAATVRQTIELVAGDNLSIIEDGTNDIGQKKVILSATQSGTSGGKTYTSGQGIAISDNDEISTKNVLMYDTDANDVATMTGSRGTKLTNLKQATLSRNSTDAVTGAQLWQTNTNIEGFASDIRTNANNITALTTSVTNALGSVSAVSTLVDIVNNTKADASLNNLTDTGRQVIASAAANAVQEYMATNGSSTGGNTGTGNNSTGNGLLGGTASTLSAPRATGFGLMSVAVSDLSDDMDNNANTDTVVTTSLLGGGSAVLGGGSAVLGADNNDEVLGSEGINEDVQAALDTKADVSYVDNGLATKADVSYVDSGLAGKADIDSVYGKSEVDSMLSVKADTEYVDAVVANKADISYVNTGLSKKADISYVDEELATKADIAYVDEGLAGKADIKSVYTKVETDTLLDAKADKKDLAKKANTDASNIDVDAWSEVLGKGEIVEGNTGLVNGGTVYEAIQQVDRNNNLVQMKDDVIFVGANEGGNVISVYNADGEGRAITGVVTNPEDPTSAANVGYVNAIGETIAESMNNGFARMDDKVNKVGANAAAMASLMPAPMDGDEKWSLSAAVGNYRNATAGAAGLFFRPSDKVIMNVRGSFGTDENMVGGGVAVALDKGSVPGVSKAQLVRTVNAQAQQIGQQAAAINQLQAERQNDKAEIAELREMVEQLVAVQQSK